jgi:NADH dehydrogenase [ubiquinone] 1 alpha subcomplex assembly factor 5
LLANLFGSGSLSSLKAVMIEADGDRISAHIHPQIDLRAMADLLVRAGFALPVADIDRLSVRYKDWRRLVDDIRAMGFGNALAGARTFLGKDYPDRLSSAWAARAEADGKVTEQFQFLQISGWAPSPDQPKPAKRGSASVSLAKILGSGV